MKSIVILTGNEIRHQFFCKYISSSDCILVLARFCEDKAISKINRGPLTKMHLMNRDASERDFFELYLNDTVPKYISKLGLIELNKGEINNKEYVNLIAALKPDMIVSYGCSIVKEPLLSLFKGRFLNIHLGLSPYYRGSGTNYWPLVNGEPEYVGATLMHIDSGVDTGEVIHQIRAECYQCDTPHTIGNRLILNTAEWCRRIIVNFDKLKTMKQLPIPDDVKVYKKSDFTDISVAKLYKNFRNGMIKTYIEDKYHRDSKVPIIVNDSI